MPQRLIIKLQNIINNLISKFVTCRQGGEGGVVSELKSESRQCCFARQEMIYYVCFYYLFICVLLLCFSVIYAV